MFNFKKQTRNKRTKVSYQLTFIFQGNRKDYVFYDIDDAVLCFYGKVVEIRLKNLSDRPEFLMSLFNSDGNILMNYHRDRNEDTITDLRPTKI